MIALKKFIAAALFGAISVAAQDQPQPAAPKAPVAPTAPTTPTPPRFGNGTTARPSPRFDRTLQDLTPEQKTKLEEVNKEFSANATPLYSRLVTARRELETAVDQEKFDEASIRAKAKAISDLEADIAVARAQRYVKLRAFLSPDQARRFNQPTPLGRPFQPPIREGQTPPNIAPTK